MVFYVGFKPHTSPNSQFRLSSKVLRDFQQYRNSGSRLLMGERRECPTLQLSANPRHKIASPADKRPQSKSRLILAFSILEFVIAVSSLTHFSLFWKCLSIINCMFRPRTVIIRFTQTVPAYANDIGRPGFDS